MKATFTHSEERQLAAQRELIENFQHIKDLKAGDVLRYTKKMEITVFLSRENW